MWRVAQMWPSLASHALPALIGAAAVTSKNRGRTAKPKHARASTGRGQVHVVRIALTGGPCAGKSSALEHIVATGKKEGFDVYCAPETATLIFNSGVTTDIFATTRGQYEFQVNLARMQLQMERTLTKIAECTGRPSIIIFDRGLMDAKGYTDEAQWKKVLADIGGGDAKTHKTGVTEEYLLSRYDCVVHLVTAADGAEKFYKWGKTTDDSGNTVIRGEPPEQARALDMKMRMVWSAHPDHVIVGNLGSFEDKIKTVTDVVMRVAKGKH